MIDNIRSSNIVSGSEILWCSVWTMAGSIPILKQLGQIMSYFEDFVTSGCQTVAHSIYNLSRHQNLINSQKSTILFIIAFTKFVASYGFQNIPLNVSKALRYNRYKWMILFILFALFCSESWFLRNVFPDENGIWNIHAISIVKHARTMNSI